MARVAIAQIELGHGLAEPPAGLLRRGVPQRQAPERRPERDRLVVERHLFEAAGLARGVRDELFGHRHQLVVVGVGLVELEHRELGVVLRRHPLVPKVPRQLVDPLHAADHEALEVQLRRDSQVEVHVERVVVRHKGPRRRAAGDRLHDRRLDLHEAAAVEEPPDRRHGLRAHFEHAAAVGVHDQIEVALAIAGLDVLQSVPLLGQRQVALGQEHDAPRPDAQLAGARPEQVPFDADVIAEIEQLEDLEVQFRQRVLADVDLDALEAVGQAEKIGLAEVPDRQHAAGGDRLDSCRPRARRPGDRRNLSPAPRSYACGRTAAGTRQRPGPGEPGGWPAVAESGRRVAS